MLIIELATIPPEGIDVTAPLTAGAMHLEADDEVRLAGDGTLACHVGLGEGGLVQVRGGFQAPLEMECGRCLEAFRHTVDSQLDLVYLPRSSEVASGEQDEDEVSLSEKDVVVAYYDEERLDLGEMVREQVLLGLSMKRVCREDCRGLCPTCGINRNRQSCECPSRPPDARLEPLKGLLSKMGGLTEADGHKES
jgi:uncharacterized protein